LATLIHNVNCSKKSQTIKPTDLFELPQDKLIKKKKFEPKSTPKELDKFLEQIANVKETTEFKI
tara:strand:- start:3273 stop:3464 length:192 start_codon:yes stop_codon:yes gene_type:complete